MNRKLHLAVLVAAALVAALFWQFELPTSVKPAVARVVFDTLPPAESSSLQAATPRGRLAPASLPARLPELFHYVAPASDGMNGERAISWNYSATGALQSGDSFVVILPSIGVPTEGVVTDESSVAGSRRLEGRLLNKDGMMDGPFSITLSEDGRFVAANFATAADHFSLEAGEQGGRIFSARRDAQQLEQGEQIRHD